MGLIVDLKGEGIMRMNTKTLLIALLMSLALFACNDDGNSVGDGDSDGSFLT